jgi:transposase, IS6 family
VGLALKQSNKNLFKGRQFTAEIILWAVRWYLQFPISYRDLEHMGDVTVTLGQRLLG